MSIVTYRLFCCVVAGVLLPTFAAHVRIDWHEELGPVKPVNAVGQPPMGGLPSSAPMFHYLKDAGIPYSRLHDVGGWMGQGLWVDIPNLFPNFDADEGEASNYDFVMTDALIGHLVANGAEPYFRLGVSIENFAGDGFPARRIYPPKDFAKWARISEHVIRHYTEGWANGFHYRIKYWEIWNEPDNFEEVEKNCMWKGDFESYIRLYGVVAPYLKAKFPGLKIGGYGSCGFYAGVGANQIKAANSSPRLEYFVVCARRFLGAVKENGWPLDFFSFHSYSEASEAIRQVRFADALLNEYGFCAERTERHFNEWLPYVGRENLGTAKQAAGIAAELIGLQNGPCDLACIYDARCAVGSYSPLFNPLTHKPHKAYYAFLAFNELRKRRAAVKAKSTDPDLWAAAAKDLNGGAVMLANDSEHELELVISDCGGNLNFCIITDATSDMRKLDKYPGRLSPHSFLIALYGE